MAAHPTRYAVAINLAVASMVLLLVAVLGLAHMIATVRPRIGRAAGVITMIGLAGPIFFQGLYRGGSHLTAPARQAAAALAVTCLISTGFISGHLEISAVAFACTSVALVPLGLRTLRAR